MTTNDFPIKTSTSRGFAICFWLGPFLKKKKKVPAIASPRSARLRLPGHCLHDLCQMAFCTGAIVKIVDPGLLGAGAEAGRQAGSEKRWPPGSGLEIFGGVPPNQATKKKRLVCIELKRSWCCGSPCLRNSHVEKLKS
jgi:hypothetical protein